MKKTIILLTTALFAMVLFSMAVRSDSIYCGTTADGADIYYNPDSEDCCDSEGNKCTLPPQCIGSACCPSSDPFRKSPSYIMEDGKCIVYKISLGQGSWDYPPSCYECRNVDGGPDMISSSCAAGRESCYYRTCYDFDFEQVCGSHCDPYRCYDPGENCYDSDDDGTDDACCDDELGIADTDGDGNPEDCCESPNKYVLTIHETIPSDGYFDCDQFSGDDSEDDCNDAGCEWIADCDSATDEGYCDGGSKLCADADTDVCDDIEGCSLSDSECKSSYEMFCAVVNGEQSAKSVCVECTADSHCNPEGQSPSEWERGCCKSESDGVCYDKDGEACCGPLDNCQELNDIGPSGSLCDACGLSGCSGIECIGKGDGTWAVSGYVPSGLGALDDPSQRENLWWSGEAFGLTPGPAIKSAWTSLEGGFDGVLTGKITFEDLDATPGDDWSFDWDLPDLSSAGEVTPQLNMIGGDAYVQLNLDGLLSGLSLNFGGRKIITRSGKEVYLGSELVEKTGYADFWGTIVPITWYSMEEQFGTNLEIISITDPAITLQLVNKELCDPFWCVVSVIVPFPLISDCQDLGYDVSIRYNFGEDGYFSMGYRDLGTGVLGSRAFMIGYSSGSMPPDPFPPPADAYAGCER